jgi:S-adenosylmethionine hydrolase
MIALFTDFGIDGPYTGQVQARLHHLAPSVPVVNLCSDLAPFNVEAAAYLLPAYAVGFPPATVFLCVVDPGVGGTRPGVLLNADDRWYVGPNEGLFALLARRAVHVECRQLPDPLGAPSSFHGRDVFAPVAASLAIGDTVAARSVPVSCLEQPDWPDDLSRVVYVDRFGNAITGMRASALVATQSVTVNGRLLKSATTFTDVTAGEAFWYANSNGLVEFAVNRGRADEILGATIGTGFSIR